MKLRVRLWRPSPWRAHLSTIDSQGTMDTHNPYQQALFYWHLELTSRCALKCPRCPRTEKKWAYRPKELSLPFIKQVFSPEFIQSEMQKLLFCGGLGDPIYHSALPEVIGYFKQANPDLTISITTNGSHRKQEWWERLNKVLSDRDEITFSIDGWNQESNQQYRVGSDFTSIVTGMEECARGPAYVGVSTILFRFNENELDRIEALARKSGVDRFDVVKSHLFGSQIPAYLDPDLGIDPLEPTQHTKEAWRRLVRSRVRLNDRRPKYAIAAQQEKVSAQIAKEFENSYILPRCRSGDKGRYIDADGILYPCSWASHPFGVRTSAHRPDRSVRWEEHLWVRHRDRFDLNHRSLASALADPVWEELCGSWKSESDAFVLCEQKCRHPRLDVDQKHILKLNEKSGTFSEQRL